MRPLLLTTLVTTAFVVACRNAQDVQVAERREAALKSEALVASQQPLRGMAVDAAAVDNKSPAAPAPGGSPSSAAFQQENLMPTMIIRAGQASIEVDSLALGVARVRELARRVGGFIGNTAMEAGREQAKAATLEIRLPSSRFDEAIAGLSPIGKLESVNISAQDVGEEYVDIAARVTNAHRLEQRLIEVLATKTGKLRDVLDIERELARVREEIERMEGRMRYLRTRVATSTLSITVHEPRPVVGERGSSSVIAEAFKQSWRNFVGFTARVIAALGTLIPTLILMAAGAVAVVALWRRLTRSKPKPE